MTYALIAALITQTGVFAWLADRKDKRHDQHVQRLLHWRHDPVTAPQADIPRAEVLYLKPEDDDAWNKLHGIAD